MALPQGAQRLTSLERRVGEMEADAERLREYLLQHLGCRRAATVQRSSGIQSLLPGPCASSAGAVYLQRRSMAAMMVQCRWRGLSVRSTVARRRQAAMAVQAAWRGRCARHKCHTLRHWRVQCASAQRRRASVVIQACHRGACARLRLRRPGVSKSREAACRIQAHVRGTRERRRLLRLVQDEVRSTAAMMVQCHWRRHQARLPERELRAIYRVLDARGQGARRIQECWRRRCARVQAVEHNSAVAIQRRWRGTLGRRTLIASLEDDSVSFQEEWFFIDDEDASVAEPMSAAAVVALLRKGQLNQDSKIWNADMPTWTPIRECDHPGLRAAVANTTKAGGARGPEQGLGQWPPSSRRQVLQEEVEEINCWRHSIRATVSVDAPLINSGVDLNLVGLPSASFDQTPYGDDFEKQLTRLEHMLHL